jgi:hypothetical protein
MMCVIPAEINLEKTVMNAIREDVQYALIITLFHMEIALVVTSFKGAWQISAILMAVRNAEVGITWTKVTVKVVLSR